jgi:hypothetical protein
MGYDNSNEFKTQPSLGRRIAALKARKSISAKHGAHENMFINHAIAHFWNSYESGVPLWKIA